MASPLEQVAPPPTNPINGSKHWLGSDKYQLVSHGFDSTGNRTPDLAHARLALYRFGHHAQCSSILNITYGRRGEWKEGRREVIRFLVGPNSCVIYECLICMLSTLGYLRAKCHIPRAQVLTWHRCFLVITFIHI